MKSLNDKTVVDGSVVFLKNLPEKKVVERINLDALNLGRQKSCFNGS